MDNSQIADCFTLLAKLTDIHGENSFKSKSYAAAAFTIDKLPMQLNTVSKENLFSIKGIGESTGKKINEFLQTGELAVLTALISKTPDGILEMLHLKGLGPKKIATIWKEMEIETMGELLYACKENRLKLYKGFGEKTQANVKDNIEFYLKSKGCFLFSQIEGISPSIKTFFQKTFPPAQIDFTGAYKRQLETVDELEMVIGQPVDFVKENLSAIDDIEYINTDGNSLCYRLYPGIKIILHCCTANIFVSEVFSRGCSTEFLEAFPKIKADEISSEADLFSKAGLQFIPPFLRERAAIIKLAEVSNIPEVIQPSDIRGIIHSHSDWSDGSNTIQEMAIDAVAKGFEYLVISDHSKSAFYANGLSEEKVKAQHQYIDELNATLAPFKIFKSIESDILNDGSLDYRDSILSTFDLVIASVHSNLKMTEDKAMMRLLKAIENPYTSILGHMTGRLLLSRKGYPVDHRKVIDACAANNVVIELNANPSRLDIDWRYIDYALERDVLISINPDAHFTEGYGDIRYGVLTAQKAMVTSAQNLSSFNLAAFETWVQRSATRRP